MSLLDAQRYIFTVVGYEPTEDQWKVHLSDARHKLITGGERAGKSKVNSKELLWHWYVDFCIPKKRGGLFWLLGSDYETTRGEWEHIVEDFQKLGQIKELSKNIDPALMILGDECQFVTKSAKHPEKIATVAPDAILGCEAAQLDYDIFLRARARLAEKRGWLSMAGTLEEEDYVSWYRELYELGQSYNNLELASFSLPTWGNTKIFPLGREDPELKKVEAGMTKERFMERFGGVPCPKSGRVVTEFANALHVKPVPFNEDLPVEIGVDVGYRGAYAVEAVQNFGEYFGIIDEIYVVNLVTEDVIDLCRKTLWWSHVIGGAIDIAGTQHQGMTSPEEIWATKGKVSLVSKRVNIEDGIDLLRTHMKVHPVTGRSGIIIDPKCQGIIAECGGGRSPVEGGGVWMRDKNTQRPLEKNDHACKALIYLLANKFLWSKKDSIYRPMKLIGKAPQPTFVRT